MSLESIISLFGVRMATIVLNENLLWLILKLNKSEPLLGHQPFRGWGEGVFNSSSCEA